MPEQQNINYSRDKKQYMPNKIFHDDNCSAHQYNKSIRNIRIKFQSVHVHLPETQKFSFLLSFNQVISFNPNAHDQHR